MPINKKEGESKDDFISRCMSEEVGSGKEQSQAYAICISKWESFAGETQSVTDNTWSTEAPINVNLESHSDYPDDVKSNAKNVLEWVDKNGWGSCGTGVGKQRANQLANGEPISLETIKRMYNYLNRHAGDLDTSTSYSEGCGKLMYDAWGGKSALSWSRNKLRELGELQEQMDFRKVSFDYDETLTTDKGMEMAQRAINRGDEVYIISARRDKTGMVSRAVELGIPLNRVIATGSNKAKVEKIKELGIDKHVDNNGDVIRMIPGVGEKFAKVKRILFDEDFSEDDVKKYKDLGFKVLVRSKRKIKKQDKKVWNKLKSVGLTEDDMVFGEVKDLHKRYNFDMLMTGKDPILEHLKLMGQDYSTRKTIKSFSINSMSEAKELELREINNVEMKFVTVRAVYFYRERPDVAPATKSGSRPFCKELMSQSNRGYSLAEIQQLPTDHLVEMGLEPDVFLYRGGFYTLPGGVRGVDTTPYCRHEWKLEIVMV